MPRIRKGAAVEKNGKWYARIRWTDESGKRRDLWLTARNKSHAQELIQEKIQELKEHGEKTVDASRMTFCEFADYFEKNFLIPAEYVDGRKVAGRRSIKGLKEQVDLMRSFFNKKLLRSISYGDLSRYKLQRLRTPTERKEKTRAIADINPRLIIC